MQWLFSVPPAAVGDKALWIGDKGDKGESY